MLQPCYYSVYVSLLIKMLAKLVLNSVFELLLWLLKVLNCDTSVTGSQGTAAERGYRL